MTQTAEKMPALFIGHGSPMNIIADNAYTDDLVKLAATLPRPQTVLVVSAHWLTHGSAVSADEQNATIYDFSGFPHELYEKSYPAPGAPAVAARVSALTGGRAVPQTRGLDHAAWAPLIRMYPAADVPVLELSLDLSLPPADHYALGRQLAPLRDEGVLIIGSGNVVHSFAEIDWNPDAVPANWAVEFDQWLARAIAEHRHGDLVNYLQHPLGRRAAPTPDHFYPLLYTLALQGDEERAATTHASIQHAVMSMRCLKVG